MTEKIVKEPSFPKISTEEVKDFTCVRCGQCCTWPGYVRVTNKEIDAIAEFLGMSPIDFIDKYTILTKDRRGLSLLDKEDGVCIFYRKGTKSNKVEEFAKIDQKKNGGDESPRCIINDVKPQQCIDFPFKWNFPGWRKLCKGAGQ